MPGSGSGGLVGQPVGGTRGRSAGLTRTTEGPGPAVTPQADPIPPEEARALADRLLGPYLPEEAEEADQEAKLAAIASLAEFDLDRAPRAFSKAAVCRPPLLFWGRPVRIGVEAGRDRPRGPRPWSNQFAKFRTGPLPT